MRERERWKREAGDACREHRRVCEVVTFPAWHQEVPVQAGQALFPRAGFFNWFFSLGAPPLFQSSLLLRSHTPLRLVLANKGDYRRVLTSSAPPIIVQNRAPYELSLSQQWRPQYPWQHPPSGPSRRVREWRGYSPPSAAPDADAVLLRGCTYRVPNGEAIQLNPTRQQLTLLPFFPEVLYSSTML